MLLAANLIPLAGIAFFGWSLFELIAVYWLENGIIGVYNLARMATVRGGSPTGLERGARMLFFTFHYGLFWAVHGTFVFALFGAGPFGGEPILGPSPGGGPFSGPGAMLGFPATGLGLAVASLVVSHGVSFVQNYLMGGERERLTLDALMTQPYTRVVVLHMTILAGGFAAGFFGSPAWALVVMVVLKIGVDLQAHLAEHAREGEPEPGA